MDLKEQDDEEWAAFMWLRIGTTARVEGASEHGN
jgi:hypothetical protein